LVFACGFVEMSGMVFFNEDSTGAGVLECWSAGVLPLDLDLKFEFPAHDTFE